MKLHSEAVRNYKKILCLLMTLAISIMAMAYAPAASEAVTYYVAPGGNDAWPGSQSQPWATLQHAADTVSAGDTVLVADGTYDGFEITTDGTNTDPIIFNADGYNVVINTRNARTPDNINIEGGDYIIIDGFKVQNAPRIGIRVVEAVRVVVRNNMVSNSQLTGILTGFAPEIQIIDNITYGTIEQHGIYVSNSRVVNDAPVIHGNVSYGNGRSGIQVNGDCYAGGDGVIALAMIENNIIYNNASKALSLISMPDSVVQNNIIYNNGTSGGGAGGIHLTDEPGCGKPSSNNIVVNNTVVEPRIAGIRITDNAINNVIFNNLIVSDRPIRDEVGGSSIDTVSNLTRSLTTGLFVDPISGDYHLLSNSPAVNAGRVSYQGNNAPAFDIEGTLRPQNSMFDIGAYEYPETSDSLAPSAPTNLQVR